MNSLIPIILFFTSLLLGNDIVNIPYFFQEKRSFELEEQLIYSVATANNGDVFAGTNDGLFVKLNNNSNWKKVSGIDNPTYFVSIHEKKCNCNFRENKK
jgi:hypothetical protein